MHSPAHQQRHLNQKLQRPSDQHADGQRYRRTREVARHRPHRARDDGDIQQHRSGRREAKNVKAVQDGHGQRRQADKKDIRKNDPIQVYGLFPRGLAGRKQCEQTHELRREHHSQHGNRREQHRQVPEQPIGKLPYLVARLVVQVVGEYRYEGCRHRSFSHEPPQQTRDAISQNEGISRWCGAQEQRNALIPDVSENTADYSNKGDDRGRLEDLLLLVQKAASQPKPLKNNRLTAYGAIT